MTKTRLAVLRYANGELPNRPASDSTFRKMEKEGLIHWAGWRKGMHSPQAKFSMSDGWRLTGNGRKILSENPNILSEST